MLLTGKSDKTSFHLSTLRFQYFLIFCCQFHEIYSSLHRALCSFHLSHKSRESDTRFNTIRNVCPSGTHISYHNDDQRHALKPPVVLQQLRHRLRTPHRPRHPRHRHPYRHLHPPHTAHWRPHPRQRLRHRRHRLRRAPALPLRPDPLR